MILRLVRVAGGVFLSCWCNRYRDRYLFCFAICRRNNVPQSCDVWRRFKDIYSLAGPVERGSSNWVKPRLTGCLEGVGPSTAVPQTAVLPLHHRHHIDELMASHSINSHLRFRFGGQAWRAIPINSWRAMSCENTKLFWDCTAMPRKAKQGYFPLKNYFLFDTLIRSNRC